MTFKEKATYNEPTETIPLASIGSVLSCTEDEIDQKNSFVTFN